MQTPVPVLASVGAAALVIVQNDILSEITGLAALNSVLSNVNIRLNPLLSDCSGLEVLLDDVDDGVIASIMRWRNGLMDLLESVMGLSMYSYTRSNPRITLTFN